MHAVDPKPAHTPLISLFPHLAPSVRALGCLDPQCSLCQHNPNRRCTVNFDRKYLVHDMLKVQAVHAYLLYACKQYGTLTSSSTILAMS